MGDSFGDRIRVLMVIAGAASMLAAAARPGHAADYYVKNGGVDAKDGLSLANAWATLPHAADAVGPGDTVHVQNGSYRGFYLTTSGNSGAPITFRAEGTSVQITQDNPTTPDGINLEGASWVVVDGFVVNDRTRTGIRAVTADHVTVRNCKLGHNGRWGILTGFVDDFTAENNEAHHSVAEHGIYVSNSCNRPIVRNNVVYSNHANGLHFNGDASLGGDGLIEDALVEGNVIYDNGAGGGGGSGINMDGSVRGTIRNNLLYNNHSSGISLYQIDAATGSTDNLIENNTVVNAADGRWCININSGSTGNVLRNNILYNYHSFRGVITVDDSSLQGFKSTNNSLMDRMSADGDNTILTLAQWQALGYDAGSFVATPAQNFVAPGTDFHLLPTSPAVDAGSAAGAPSTDLEGAPRPAGAGYDIGAYELQLTSCGNGTIDPGEQCESDSDCPGNGTCRACAGIQPAICSSGIAADHALLVLRATPFSLRAKGQAVIPKPWTGVDPKANGIRVVFDDVSGSGRTIDASLPGGARWTVSRAATQWIYKDPAGAVAGVTRAVVQDRSRTQSGLITWRVVGRGGAVILPDVTSVRSTAVLGAALECAVTSWNGPGQARPRCEGSAARFKCR